MIDTGAKAMITGFFMINPKPCNSVNRLNLSADAVLVFSRFSGTSVKRITAIPTVSAANQTKRSFQGMISSSSLVGKVAARLPSPASPMIAPLARASRSLGHQSAFTLNAAVQQPDMPIPISKRPTSRVVKFPAANSMAPIAAMISNMATVRLAPSRSSRMPVKICDPATAKRNRLVIRSRVAASRANSC